MSKRDHKRPTQGPPGASSGSDAVNAPSRTTVPDAATGLRPLPENGCDKQAHDTMNRNINRVFENNLSLVDELEAMQAERDAAIRGRQGWYEGAQKITRRAEQAEVERDAAVAAVERVRAVVKSIRFLAALPPSDEGNTVMNAAADDIVAALDGKEKNDE